MQTEKPPSPRQPLERELTLEWIPKTMRTMLDRACIRISLAQWQQLPMPAREQLAALCTQTGAEPTTFASALRSALAAANAGEARTMGQ